MAEERARVIVKRVSRRTHHYGSAWKVAYADFSTAMMALFIVLWLLTQADMRLRQQIAQYFRDPGVLPGGAVVNPEASASKSREPKVIAQEIILVQGDGEQKLLEGQKAAIEEELKKAAEENPELAAIKDQVIVQVTDAGLSIQVVDKGRDVLFDLSSSKLKPALVELLKKLGAH